MYIFSLTFFLTVLFISIILNYLHYMHMYQLNGYNAKAHFKWMSENKLNIFLRHMGGLAVTIALFFTNRDGIMLLASGICITAFIWFAVPHKAKKKLVFTPRVIRMCVTSALIYVIFTAAAFIIGLNTKAICLLPFLQILTPFTALLANFFNKPTERAVNNHYINDAKRIINNHPNLIVFGITGSYGKTSVKYYLNTLLSVKYNVLITPESYNTTMGVVKTIRSSLTPLHEIFICEMGAKNIGEIKEICDIVKPKHSMITSIGPQHLESFKSIENILKTKFEIADCVTDGTVFLNGDNEYINGHILNKNIIKYGTENKTNLDYKAGNISVSEKGTCFTVTASDGETCEFNTKLIGAHNVQNIIGAIAAAHFFGISFKELLLPVKRLESVPHRLQMIDGKYNLIIDDAFNSNPQGAKAALDVLKMLNGVKFLVTPGMVELGEREYELNKEFGAYAADICDYAVLIGEKQAKPIKEGLLSMNFKEEKIEIFTTLQEGIKFIESINTKGVKKIILLENDLPDNY